MDLSVYMGILSGKSQCDTSGLPGVSQESNGKLCVWQWVSIKGMMEFINKPSSKSVIYSGDTSPGTDLRRMRNFAFATFYVLLCFCSYPLWGNLPFGRVGMGSPFSKKFMIDLGDPHLYPDAVTLYKIALE